MRPVEIVVTQQKSLTGLDELWRGIEAEVPDLSFFQSWSWVGCLVEERFPDPVVLRATQGGRLVGLALLNRRRGRLHLGESGDAVLDAPFVEHNGPLALGIPGVRAALLHAAAHLPGARRLILGGVPADVLENTPGIALRCQERLAPHVDLAAVRASGGDHLKLLSANTRYQIRRSAKHYGAPQMHRAGTEAEALEMLSAMIALHHRSWQARGKPGAFADPFMRRFHETLLHRAMARDEVDLLRVQAGESCVGILYNFRLRGRIYAYQSGLDLEGAGPHGKPGLTCHAMAIAHAVEAGHAVYDLLAGDDRYKLSLAQATTPLYWAEMVRRRSMLGLAVRGLAFARAHVPGIRNSSLGSNSSAEGPGPA
ncbi:MAG: hypothetical protein JWR10_513 [Rubritepida sp.]|nr:hypothetical protein [Rubritepida sp.]